MTDRLAWIVATALLALWLGAGVSSADEGPKPGNQKAQVRAKHPVPPEKLARINDSLKRHLTELTHEIGAEPKNADLYSQRGTVSFFLSRFEKAAADFDREVELQPDRLPSHWRRGIALYYAGRYEESANQFGDYHTQDSYGDRENGIWHFLANAARLGVDEAREKMLVYTKDDRRGVMNRVYALYAGKTTAEEVLASIESANFDAAGRDQQLFYAHLYIGWLTVAEKKPDRARHHLYEAVANKWGQSAAGGPGYMWHTARVHYDLLVKPSNDES